MAGEGLCDEALDLVASSVRNRSRSLSRAETETEPCPNQTVAPAVSSSNSAGMNSGVRRFSNSDVSQ